MAMRKSLKRKQASFCPKNIIAGVDFGYINPSAIVVILIDNDDIFYVVDELYKSGLTIMDLIYEGQKLKEKYGIELFFADPSQPAYIKEMNNQGLYTLSAKNDILPGISAVNEKMRENDSGKPSLIIDKRCKNLIYELENYRYIGEKGKNHAYAEIPVKKDDHACDALRYAVYSMKSMFKPRSFRPKWL
jgi:phage terminase large subunit